MLILFSICFVSYSWKHIQNVILYTYPSYFCMQAFPPIQVGSRLPSAFQTGRKKQLQDSEAKVVSDALAKGAPQVGFGVGRMKNDLTFLEVEGFCWVVKVLIPHGQST